MAIEALERSYQHGPNDTSDEHASPDEFEGIYTDPQVHRLFHLRPEERLQDQQAYRDLQGGHYGIAGQRGDNARVRQMFWRGFFDRARTERIALIGQSVRYLPASIYTQIENPLHEMANTRRPTFTMNAVPSIPASMSAAETWARGTIGTGVAISEQNPCPRRANDFVQVVDAAMCYAAVTPVNSSVGVGMMMVGAIGLPFFAAIDAAGDTASVFRDILESVLMSRQQAARMRRDRFYAPLHAFLDRALGPEHSYRFVRQGVEMVFPGHPTQRRLITYRDLLTAFHAVRPVWREADIDRNITINLSDADPTTLQSSLGTRLLLRPSHTLGQPSLNLRPAFREHVPSISDSLELRRGSSF